MSKSLKANRIWAQQSEAIAILREIDTKDLSANRADVALVAKLFNMKPETVLEMAGKLRAAPAKEEPVMTEEEKANAFAEEIAVALETADAAGDLAAAIDARLAAAE